MHLLDRSYSGVAYGVGTQRIIGRVHVANLQMGAKDFLSSSFNVVENEPLEMLLGLDTLKRHRCKIDLEENSLVIGSSGNRVEFLEGRELPDLSGVANKEDEEQDAGLKDQREDVSQNRKDHFNDIIGQIGAAIITEESPRFNSPPDGEEVEKIVQMGFDRQLARQELSNQNGDVNQAIAALLAKSLSFS